MKIVIGITQEPERIVEFVSLYQGEPGSLTELGPFLSKIEALNWLSYLKNKIGDIEEIIPQLQPGKDVIWYGFTFEQVSNTRNST